MIGRWKLGAQLSTSHSCRGSLDPFRMLETVRREQDAIDLDLLIVGFRESPEIFRDYAVPAGRSMTLSCGTARFPTCWILAPVITEMPANNLSVAFRRL
jgi:hypothetical protein